MLQIVIKSLKKVLSEKEINELKVKVLIEAPLLFPSWRKGQAYFNYLYQLHPDVADKIRGTEFDPFYADHKNNPEEEINKFLDYISKN